MAAVEVFVGSNGVLFQFEPESVPENLADLDYPSSPAVTLGNYRSVVPSRQDDLAV